MSRQQNVFMSEAMTSMLRTSENADDDHVDKHKGERPNLHVDSAYEDVGHAGELAGDEQTK